MWLFILAALATEPGAENVLPSRDVAPTSGAALGPGAVPADLAALARDVRNAPLAARIDAISASLLGRPYVNDPAGEGSGHDPDPPARYDVFDCLTFVEEVVALALAPDPVDAARIRHALRYGDDDAHYAARHHFMELQWIPSAVDDGWLRQTTAQYGAPITLTKEVDADTWAGWGPRTRFPIDDGDLPVGTMTLEVLPLDQARQAVARIAPGSLVMAVRSDRAGVPIWITHVGFLVPGDNGPTFRHATRMSSSLRVRDNQLAWYLDHLGTYANWPTVGIAVFEPVEQGPRRIADQTSRR
jgi:hypothetical protein